ncbi:elongation factor 1-beta [Candidatus Pacearchaeota archaeon]|nr:elongation factor 1-beta [Candidatus Pacearchaeota archaeon]
MALAVLKIKIMPVSPKENLDVILKEAERVVSEITGARLHASEKEPIAFGLVALILTVAWPEEKEQDIIESNLSKIKGVNSAQIIDFRRAFG